MHFFIKKTNELVKKQKIPFSKIDLIKKRGVYIRILLGERKNKSFYLFENQLQKIDSETPLSNFEIKCLKESHSDMKKWKDVCNIIKLSRGNKYPKDWLNVLRKEKLMNDGKNDKSTLINLLNGLIKPLNNVTSQEVGSPASFGFNPTASTHSTIIIVDSDSTTQSKNSPNIEKSDKIYFESKIYDTGDVYKNIDFITRFDINYLIDKNIIIFKDSEFELDYPFKNLKVKTSTQIKNTKDLYNFILNKVKSNESYMENGITLEDIGIDYIKKCENKKYTVHFLY
jgi:hypothetical protein